MKKSDKVVGYRIAREALKDESTKILSCTEAVAALMLQSYLQSTGSVHKQESTTDLCKVIMFWPSP